MGFAGKSEHELAIESRLKRDSQAAAFRAGLGADGVSSLLHGTDLALLLPANCPRAAANRALLEEVMTPQQVRQFHQYLSAERAKEGRGGPLREQLTQLPLSSAQSPRQHGPTPSASQM
eukprot:gnl/Ergobibamus_cyprinoides/3570.p2 GENE.gnl/Ergobibamus_cyprinoides/3570~~gnl/Ergobibamus_cyprinoides/3570.p2  ORF type:complete len:119 (+),score=6.03 gnl/Ergobibamus_cyprinoides/3570:333-689(+)